MKSGNAVRCILVLGMHGSGASALTRMFSLAGAALPRTLLEANEADGTGCWEPEKLVRYHDRLLSDLGSGWHDWKPLDFPSLPLSDRKTIHSDIKSILADEFGGRRLWVLKEPRICRFVPIYREVLSDMGVALSPVLIFRNPLEVMASLQRRGDWPVERSAADACLLWLRHVLDCEAATRGVKRSIASHASIVSDPVAALARIERKAKLDFPNKVDELGEDIREFLDPASGGHEKGGGEAALEPMLRGWVEDAFSAMRALERNPGSKKARKTLDRVNEAFGASLPVIDAFGTASREALAHKHKLEEEREQARLDFEGLDRLTEEQKSRIESLDRIVGEQSGQLDAIRRLFDVGEGDNRTIDEVIGAHLHSLQAEYDSRLNAQKSRIGSLDRIAGEQSGQLDAIRRLFDVREGDNRTIDEVIGAHLHSLQAEYDSRLNAQTEDYEGILNSQTADYEEWLAARTEEFAREKDELTGEIASQAADYEGLLAARTEEFTREKDRLTGEIVSLGEDYAKRLDSQAADYEEWLAARTEEFAREKDELTGEIASQAADYEEWLAARTEEFAREKDELTGEIASQAADYEGRLAAGTEEFTREKDRLTGEIASQAADYEEWLAARTEEFTWEKDRLTGEIASLGEDYAERLDGQAADYEERLAARTEEFAREKDELTGEIASLGEDYAERLDSQAADYEGRLAARTEEFAREKDRLTDQMASLGEDYAERLDGQAADYEERLAARTEEFAREKDRLTGEIASLGEDYEERLAARTEEFAREKDRLADQMASLGDERDAISGEAQYLNAANNDLRAAYDAASLDLRREKTTVLRPIYRNVYGAGGRLMRGVLPESVVHWVKDKVPDPDGARFNGASLDLPYAPTDPARLEDVSPGVGKPDVFVLSIIDWDFRIQRPQHIARALSSDRRVFYVEMMMEREEPAVRKITDNLWAVRLSMDGAGHIQPYSGEPDADRQAAWVRSFFEFCRVVDVSPFKQIVVQHPFWWNLVRHLPPEFEIVFDCMDDITGFSNTSQAVIDLENDLLKGCDKLVVSSQYLFDKYCEFKAPALIRNGGDIDHFSAAAAAGPAPPFLAGSGFEKREGTIDAGYVGAVAEWFDHELIRRTATQNPDIRFHICGDVTVPEPAALDDLDNVHLYGEIAYDDVPAFIRQMDVMTIPFKLLPIIHACDPVKFYEHSAMGKPTVSTRLPELMRAGELIYFAETAEQYGARIRDACAAGPLPEYRDKLRLYAAENSWAHRGEEFDAALGRFAKVSVVILAFGDALWTGTTLQSLFDGGDHYPDLEVIVVDNGSDDATLAELRKICASHPGVRLIENGENLGFARGNNAGLSAAAGEYVLLLNNDTYLAPGAIHAMVRHLRDNPGIGVVGPLTNNIGNEARLDVHYADMAEMIDVARSVTTGYRGMYSPVRVSAYFAAMFRTADLETFGLLPEEYGRGMFEDDDHCETIRKHGFICALAEDAFVHHHLSGTFSTIGGDEKRRLFERNRAIFEAKWGAWIPHEYRSDRPVGSLSNDNLKPTADIAPFRRFSRLPQGQTP